CPSGQQPDSKSDCIKEGCADRTCYNGQCKPNPTATPTSSPTPTPTATPNCSNCAQYSCGYNNDTSSCPPGFIVQSTTCTKAGCPNRICYRCVVVPPTPTPVPSVPFWATTR
ncbi:MAG: hypothetical protein EBU90_12935, partial [Proteobacteria bacterium]|nr:hypothetical protein [Pseudomonadota bacterium]